MHHATTRRTLVPVARFSLGQERRCRPAPPRCVMPPTLSPEDRQFIDRAAHYLDNPGFLIRLANLLGQPLEAFAKVVPDKVHEVAEKALKKAMELAIRTVPPADGAADDTVQQLETSTYW